MNEYYYVQDDDAGHDPHTVINKRIRSKSEEKKKKVNAAVRSELIKTFKISKQSEWGRVCIPLCSAISSV